MADPDYYRSADLMARLLVATQKEHYNNPEARQALDQILDQAKRMSPDGSAIPTQISKWIVGSLCIALLLCIFGIFYILVIYTATDSQTGQKIMPEIPNALVALTSGLLGALTGFLAPSPFNRR